MTSPIVGFHADADGHWVAELACGHTQHMRHDPPWQNRPWVLSAEGRATFIGIEIRCTNQVGEMQCPGFATVYLPSREHGEVQLPIPHTEKPPFVPFETHRRLDWY